MKCTFIKSDGSACKASAMVNETRCWYHSEKVTSKKSVNNGLPLELPPIVIKSSADIPLLLIDTIGRLRQGTIHVRAAATLGYLSHILLRAYEIADLEVRVKTLEEKIPLADYTLLVPTKRFEDVCKPGELCEEEHESD